jgi:Fe-S cluster biogenesis protein NfuA
MYLVESTAEEVHIHLAGACAGCPGAQFTTERIIEPALRNAHPKGRVRVTTGYLIPTGATLIP